MTPIESTCNNCPIKPEITEEEDKPFQFCNAETLGAKDIPTQMKLNDQKHAHEVDNFKNSTGKRILYGCLFAILLIAIADSIWDIQSDIMESTFDVFKIVATTILGYFFGSKSK